MVNTEQQERQNQQHEERKEQERNAGTLYKRIRQQKVYRSCSVKYLKKKQENKSIDFVNKFRQKLMRRTFQKKKPEAKLNNFVQRNTVETKMASSTLLGRLPLKEYRHKIHPNSKLILNGKDYYNERNLTMASDSKLNKRETEQAYRLQTVRHQNLIEEERFRKLYSGGPTVNQLERVNCELRQTTKELRAKAAVTIQRYYKGYIERMRYMQMRRMSMAKQAKQTRGEISKNRLSLEKERIQSNLYRATISMLNLKRAETKDFSDSKSFNHIPITIKPKKVKKESILKFQNKVQKEY